MAALTSPPLQLPSRTPLAEELRSVISSHVFHIIDLSSYTYLGLGNDRNLLAVGWLDAEHQFVKGSVPHRLLTVVLALGFEPVNQTCGFHESPFLNPSPVGYPVEYIYKRQKMLLGSAEIRVPGRAGKTYAAPNLIYHYMKYRGYLPPQEFLDALDSMGNA